MMRDHGKPATDFQRVDCEIGDIAGTPDRGLDRPTPGLVGSHSLRGPKYVVKKGKTPLEEFSSDVSSDLPPDVIPGKFLNSLRVILWEDMRVFLRFLPGDGIDLA